MEKEKVIIRLSTQIDTIRAHVNRLKKPGYDIHSLDVDMLRQKTYEFYEQVFELENLVAVKTVVGEKPAPVIESTVKEIKKEDLAKEVVKEKVEVSIEEPEPIKPLEQIIIKEPEIASAMPEPEPAIEIKVQKEETTEPIVEEEIIEDLPEHDVEPILQKQTTYDLFAESSENVVAEKFHTHEEQSIADKMQKSQISNIREAIGINEKFLFINELFNGDLGRYNKIMDDINELPTKKGVDTYLLELKIQFQWADENDAYIKLKELLERKFS